MEHTKLEDGVTVVNHDDDPLATVWLKDWAGSLEVEPSAVEGNVLLWSRNVVGQQEPKITGYIRITTGDLERFGFECWALAQRMRQAEAQVEVTT